MPYLYFNIISYLFWLFIGSKFGLDENDTTSSAAPLFGIIYGTSKYLIHYAPLWFFTCLFVTESLFFLIFKQKKFSENKILIVFIFLIIAYLNYIFNPIALPWGIDVALTMLIFYTLANVLKPYILKETRNPYILFVLSAISLVALIFLSLHNVDVKASGQIFGNYFLFFSAAISGITFIISTAKIFEKAPKSNLLFFVGNNTLAILVLHLFAFTFLKGIMVYVLKIDIYAIANSLWYSLLISFLAIAVSAPVIILINKYAPFLVGKK